MLWFSTTAWMMWNALVSGLLVGASIVLIDGSPVFPDLAWPWRLAEETGATLMGASPGFLMTCRREGLEPAKQFDLSRIRQIGAAGSPLPAEGYHWVSDQFGPDVLLNVGSGGTDVCTGLVQGSPLQPVYAGEISGPCLGVDARAFDAAGAPVPPGTLGELVVTAPMPSMPVGFWGDPDGSRLRETYFDTYPRIWRHGDWIQFSEVGSCVITGRSDATLNRGGVRLGTAEFYRVVEEIPGIVDSLVVHLEDPAGGNGELVLFVQLASGVTLDPLRGPVRDALRTALSPRHVPDTIAAVPVVPRNRTGKKLEVPVKRVLLGAAPGPGGRSWQRAGRWPSPDRSGDRPRHDHLQDELDAVGGILGFPLAKQHYYAASTAAACHQVGLDPRRRRAAAQPRNRCLPSTRR